MKICLFILLTILFHSCSSRSISRTENDRRILLNKQKQEDITALDLNETPELFLHKESALQDNISSSNLYSNTYYTGIDESRFSVSLNYSQDYEDPTKVQMMDFQYFSKSATSYTDFWWAYQLKRTVAKYSAISEESTSDLITSNRSSNTQSFTIFGLGLSHRFRALSSQFFTDRFFETVSVFGNYIFHLDGSNDKKYQGYGYTADYVLQYRSSKRLFYGPKLSYNWAAVSRSSESDSDEKLPARSLVFGWLTIGFELGFYF